MSFEIKQLVKDSNFRQVELRLISDYRNFRKLLHIFSVPVAEIDCVLHIISFVSRLLNQVGIDNHLTISELTQVVQLQKA